MDKIRAALDYVSAELKCEHPLVAQEFETDGVSLFITKYNKLIDASARGQEVIPEIIHEHLKRLERDDRGVVRLYPFTRAKLSESNPRSVFIDPRFSFGRLVLASVGVPTAAFAERYSAGESIEHLAEDYGCGRLDVEEAIRCELRSLESAA